MKTMILICNFEKLGCHFLRVKPICYTYIKILWCIRLQRLQVQYFIFRLLVSVFFIFIYMGLNGQSQMKPNTLYFQLGGNGLFTSINYERQIIKHPTVMIHGGIGHYGINTPFVTIPLGMSYLLKLKKSNSGFDFGLGVTFTKADVTLYAIVEKKPPYKANNSKAVLVPRISYRAQSHQNIMFRIEFLPIIGKYGVLPFIGFSLGKSF